MPRRRLFHLQSLHQQPSRVSTPAWLGIRSQGLSAPIFLLPALLLAALLSVALPVHGQTVPAANEGVRPNLVDNIGRPLRYRPDGGDFVIENGTEVFNRPLYGGDTAFRVDGGDQPEFVLYLPGRGGNLRLGLERSGDALWLADAARIETRYRPGQLIHEIRDPLLGSGVLTVTAVAYAETEGLILRIEGSNLPPQLQLVWAFGGINGERGVRDGDIGTERVPISEWFQFKPAFAAGNSVTVGKRGFTVSAPMATLVGRASTPTAYLRGDAHAWNDLPALLRSTDAAHPTVVAVARSRLPANHPVYVSLQRVAGGARPAEELDIYKETRAPAAAASAARALPPAFAARELPRRFAQAESHFAALRARVAIDTPDLYLDAAMGALNVAAEATWDGAEQAVMHGAIAWRAKLLGWRGPHWLDPLGRPERADRHFRYWAKGQNTAPIPAAIPPPEPVSNLARNETALHSNGDLSKSHYDMNTVYIDALFRHLEWTGDLALARALWPTIERHLAWERRLFRRTFGPDKLPLYEAYAVIWASDDLYYSGGGATHSSAYQYFHNTAAAKLATLLGEDPAPYQAEAAAIWKGMHEYLWMPDAGAFGEYRDWLGAQRLHPSFGLWTHYHVMDSGAATRAEAWRMSAAMKQSLPLVPVVGPGVPDDAPYGMHSTTSWMPYSWSINNVATQENLHAALALWQAGLNEDAFTLAKSSILASMFMGISPGNLGTLAYPDVYRRESQRDFADSAGVTARAMVEGLFGIEPRALSRTLLIRPGFPRHWTHASISHPMVRYEFTRTGSIDRWSVRSQARQFSTIALNVAAPRDTVAEVRVDGRKAAWTIVDDSIGQPRIEVRVPGRGNSEITIRWAGEAISTQRAGSPAARFVPTSRGNLRWLAVEEPGAAQTAAALEPQRRGQGAMAPLDISAHFNDAVTNIFAPSKYLSPRSPYVSLAIPSQGVGAWAGHVNLLPRIDDRGLRQTAALNGGLITTPDGVPFSTPGGEHSNNVVFTSLWDNYPREATVTLSGRAMNVHLLMAGSTNFMQSRFENGAVVVTYSDQTTERLSLRNPDNWWPIEQDYFIDDYQFRVDAPLPARVDLASGKVRVLDARSFKGKGREVPGGAATILCLPLDPQKSLERLAVRTTANDVVIGLMAVTLERPR